MKRSELKAIIKECLNEAAGETLYSKGALKDLMGILKEAGTSLRREIPRAISSCSNEELRGVPEDMNQVLASVRNLENDIKHVIGLAQREEWVRHRKGDM